jgi:hypothetical protein
MRDKGIILLPKEISFECYADADFCGLWNQDMAEHNPYVALSVALRQVIWIMDLLEEMKVQGTISLSQTPTVYCKAFEDNLGALEMARMPRMRPCTKHINVSYHHFCSHVAEGKITIHAIGTADQIGDLWTKPLGAELFAKFTKIAFGWDIKKAKEMAREAIKNHKKTKHHWSQ